MESRARTLLEAGLCTRTPAGLRLRPAGLERLTALLDGERARVDRAALDELYAEFRAVDLELKKAVTAWQLRDERAPNDHTDPASDRRVLRRLAGIHARAGALLERLESLVPRLSPYRPRLAEAHRRIAAGDAGFIAGPLIDSYHTVWFELHEELLTLTGARRSAE